ncbi:MAG TPA: MBG domain-containing protein, partial [Pirellulales bacterium]
MSRKAAPGRRAPRAKSQQSRPLSRWFRASFEQLEGREMLAADDLLIGLYAGGGVLRDNPSTSPATPIQGAGAVAPGDHGLTNVSGVATAPDGTFYASNATTGQVAHYSNWGAYLGAFAGAGTSLSGVKTPGTLAFGANGDLYVADTTSGAVSWFNTTTGAMDGSITLPSGDTPGGIAFAHNGDLIVGDLTSGAVLQYNTGSGGNSATPLVPAGTAVGNNTNMAGAFLEPVAILAQNNGDLLIADGSQANQSAHEQVALYNATTETTSQFIGLSSQPQTLLRAQDGNLLIGLAPSLTSANGGEVEEYDIRAGTFISTVASSIAAPGALAYAPATLSDLLVGDYDNSQVRRYDATSLASTPLTPVPGNISTSGGTAPNQWGMAQTSNVTVAPDGTIYVSSLGTGQVLRFSADGQTLIGVFASFGGAINVAAPGALAFGPNGDLYIADLGYAGDLSATPPIPAVPANVSWYNTTTGHQDGTITLPNNGAGTMPGALAFAQNGDLLVSNLGDGSVTEFNSANVGTMLVAPFSSVGNDPGYPGAYLMTSSIVALPNGNLLIADENYDNTNDHHQIVLYNSSTGALTQFINLTTPLGTQSGKVGDFAQPESMTISHRGTLLVEVSPDHASNGAIQEYNLTTGAFIGTLVSGIGTPAGLVYARPSPARTAPTINWPTPSPITYGAVLTGTQLDATTTPAGTYTYTLADGSTPALGAVLPAGEQTLNVLFTPSDTTTYTAAIGQVEIDVQPVKLTVTANNASRAYGAADPTFTDTISGFVNGDSSSVVSGAASFASTDSSTSGVGTYSIIPAAGTLSAANYTFNTFVNGTLTVNQAALTITANSIGKTYGQAQTFTGTEFTTTGLVNSDTVTSVSLVSAGAVATAGVSGSPYQIVPSAAQGPALANYSITYVNGKLTVNAAPLTITADNATKTYGVTKTFAGTEFTTSGLVNGDSVASVTLTSTGAVDTATVSGATYPIVPSAALGTGLSNYSITYVNGQLTVNAAPLTITANNISKTYGQTTTLAGTEFSASGLVNGDTVTSVALASTGAAGTALVSASPYPVVPSAAQGAGLGNYSITYT